MVRVVCEHIGVCSSQEICKIGANGKEKKGDKEIFWVKKDVKKNELKSEINPIKVETKVVITTFERQVNAKLLDSHIKQMKAYFHVYSHTMSRAQRISFAWLKMSDHALVWWES